MLSAPSSEARLHEACQLHCPEARLFARFNMAIMVRLIEDLSHGAMCFAFINLLFLIQRYLPYFFAYSFWILGSTSQVREVRSCTAPQFFCIFVQWPAASVLLYCSGLGSGYCTPLHARPTRKAQMIEAPKSPACKLLCTAASVSEPTQQHFLFRSCTSNTSWRALHQI